MIFPPSLKNAFLFFALGLLLGLFLSLLWGLNEVQQPPPPIIAMEAPRQLEKAIRVAEANTAKKMDSLHQQNSKLSLALQATKMELVSAQKKTGKLQVQLLALADHYVETKPPGEGMSATPCDSIATLLPLFVATVEAKDSLYRNVISHLESQGQNKDSLLSIQQRQYVALQSSFMKSIEAQTLLAGENETLQKTIRRQKTKSKIGTAALFLLSGAAAAILLHR